MENTTTNQTTSFNRTMENTTTYNTTSFYSTDSTVLTAVNSSKMELYKITLTTIYTLVLLMGSIGLPLMIHMVKSSLHSWTNIAFLNLIVVHLLFLLTTPFRIHYYATNRWSLSAPFCRLVSAMIHVHMYIVFVIYVIILAINFLQYYKERELEFYRKLYALVASFAIWSILIIVGPITFKNYYGTARGENDTVCFQFGDELKKSQVQVFNIILSVFTILVSCFLSSILAVIFYKIIKKYGAASRHQHEFWVQVKSASIIAIIATCLVPYHLFRLYYAKHHKELQPVNEVFLAITTVTCFDMLFIFAGRGICQRCGI